MENDGEWIVDGVVRRLAMDTADGDGDQSKSKSRSVRHRRAKIKFMLAFFNKISLTG